MILVKLRKIYQANMNSKKALEILSFESIEFKAKNGVQRKLLHILK